MISVDGRSHFSMDDASSSSSCTDNSRETPVSSTVTPYIVSATSIVPLRCVTTMNCVCSANSCRKRPKRMTFASSSGASISSSTEKGDGR